MTQPTITYGHVFLTDCDATTNWHREAGAPDLDGAAADIQYGDYLKLYCVDAHDGDSCYWTYYDEAGASNIGASVGAGGIGKKIMIRYKTSLAAAGLGLAVKLVFTGGAVEWAFGTDVAPIYSSFANMLETATYTIVNAGATNLDHIRLYAISEKDDNHEYIFVDFLLAHVGTYTFPFISKSVNWKASNNNVKLSAPGRKGNISQYLGSISSPITITGHTDSSDGWHDNYGVDEIGVMLQVLDESNTNPWQWFTCDVPKRKHKVTVDDYDCTSNADAEGTILSFIMGLTEYRHGDASGESYVERYGTYP